MDIRSTTDIPDTEAEKYPPTAQGWYCVTILALVVLVNFLDRGILTLLVEPIKADLGLSDVQMSLVMGFAFTFFYAIFGLPVARLVDRYSRKHILAADVAIWSLMTAFCGLAGNALAVGVHTGIAGAAEFAALPPDRRPQLSFAGVADLRDYLAGAG